MASEDLEKISSRAGMVSFLTFVSRLFGLLRDTMIASILGAKEASDAFYTAFRIPNLLRRLLAEGSLTISFVPVFTESLKQDPQEAKKIANATFTVLSLILLVVTVLGVIGAVWLVKLTASGFQAHDLKVLGASWLEKLSSAGFQSSLEKFKLTVQLTQITFPYIFLVSLGALAMGILNSLKSFAAPAASPVLLNLGIIAAGLFLAPHTSNPSVALAIGVLIGGVMQLALQIPPLIKRGYLPRFHWNPKHPGMRKIVRLILPSIYGSAVYQINIVAISQMASWLDHGSVTYLWYADRVMEFPLGVFAISLATIILAQLSEHAAEKDFLKLKSTFREGLKLIYFINLPAMVGLVVLAPLIISTLFRHGNFSAEDVQSTANVLQCFALGLPFVSGARIITSVFYALQDSKTPVKAATYGILTNIVMGYVLMQFLGRQGLALGVASGSLCNLLVQFFDLRRKIGLLGMKQARWNFLKIFVASAVMGAGLWGLMTFMAPWVFVSFTRKVIFLMVSVGLGVGIYAMVAYLLKVEEFDRFLVMLRRKLKKKT